VQLNSRSGGRTLSERTAEKLYEKVSLTIESHPVAARSALQVEPTSTNCSESHLSAATAAVLVKIGGRPARAVACTGNLNGRTLFPTIG
jgi:hypothetical protein